MLSILYAAYRAIARLFDASTQTEQDRDQRYLAESADIYDLERRMRHLDADRSQAYAVGATGIFSR